MSDLEKFPKYQIDTFGEWCTVPIAAYAYSIPERTLRQWLDNGRVPYLDWCGMRVVRLKDVRLAVATPPKLGRPAKREE